MAFGDTLSERFGSNRRGTDGTRVDKYPRIHYVGNSRRDSKDDGGIKVWTWAIQMKDHLHVNVQWHHIVNARTSWILYGEFRECCSICQEVPAGMMVISGTWLWENVVRNSCQQAKWWMEQNCWSHGAQLCRKRTSCISSHQRFRKRRSRQQRRWKEDHPLQQKWRNRWIDSSHCYFFLISSVSTEQSKIYAKNQIQIQEIILKVRYVNLWWYHLRVQHHWHSWICCKITKGNSQNFLVIRHCRNYAPSWFLKGNCERTILHFNWRGIWGCADNMSRVHATSKSEKHPDQEGGFVRIRKSA